MLPPLTCRTNSVTWTHILTLDTARGQKGGSIPPLVHRQDPGDNIGLTEVRQRMEIGSKCATHRVQNWQGCQSFNGEEYYVQCGAEKILACLNFPPSSHPLT